MKLLITCVSVLVTALFASCTESRFDNYKVVRLNVVNDEQANVVQDLERNGYLYMDQPHGKGYNADIIVPPHKFAEMAEIIQKYTFNSTVLLDNLQQVIDKEGRFRGNGFDWTSYYPLENIYKWMDDQVAAYPGIVTPLDIGKSYEGRKIRGVKISYRTGNPGIFIESNIHAREWISSAVSTWIINHLLTSEDPAVRQLAQTIDWYVVPLTNPDGFVYTRTNRMWRKTRQPTGGFCVGADPNRNFDFFWKTGGSSSNGCLDTYAGASAFSEPETKALADFYSTIAANITGYIDFHSYSQLLMYPYGASKAGEISNEQEHVTVGNAMQRALAQRYGTKYKFGNIVTTIYEASGGSIDWVKGVHDTPFVFVYELRDTGRHGFLLPASQIVPNAEEVWDSLEVFVNESRKLGYFPQ